MAKALTITIDADVSKFKQKTKSLQNSVQTLKYDADNLVKALELNYSPDKAVRAQEKIKQALEKSEECAETLRLGLKKLELEGQIDSKEYEDFSKRLSKAELEAEQLHKQLEKIESIKLDNTSNQFKQLGDNISNVGKKLSIISAGSAALLATGAKLGKDAIAAADDIGTLATKYGITAEELQRLQYIAMQTDVPAETLYKSLVKTRSAVTDLATGVENNATKALDGMKLSLEGLSEGETFKTIITYLSQMQDKTLMMSYANEIFGDKLANELVPMISASQDAIEQYNQEFDSMTHLTNDQVAELSSLDNSMNKVKAQLANAITQIGTVLAPVLVDVCNILAEKLTPLLEGLAEKLKNINSTQLLVTTGVLAFTATIGPMVVGVGQLVSAVGTLSMALPKLGMALTALEAHPIVLAISAAIALLGILLTQSDGLRSSISGIVGTLTNALKPALDIVIAPFKMIGTLLETSFKLIGNLVAFALTPLKVSLKLLEVPLKLISGLMDMLNWCVEQLANQVIKLANLVLDKVNVVLSGIEWLINGAISGINALIRGINYIPGVDIPEIQEISLQLEKIAPIGGGSVDSSAPTVSDSTGISNSDMIYDIPAGTSYSEVNNDYSTKNVEQNVTIVIENYAAEIDENDLVERINRKLAEAM